MTRTLPPGDPLGPEGTVMSGPEARAVTAAFAEDLHPRDKAGRFADVNRRLDAIPRLLGTGGQLHNPADRRLAAHVGDISDELAEGPDAADWGYIRGKMAHLADAQQDAALRGQAGDGKARVLAGELAGLHGALAGLAPQAGDGGGKGLSPDVLAAVDRNLARFAETGQGYPVGDQPLSDARVANYASELEEMGGQLRKKADRERWAADKGVQFTGFALDQKEHMPGTKVFVALDKGRVTRRALRRRVAGAISFYEQEGEGGERFIHVDYLGTTGVAAGAGTALAHAVARYAAARHLGVMGEPENPGADAFWSKLGWHGDPLDLGATTFAGWTPDEAAEVAARGQ